MNMKLPVIISTLLILCLTFVSGIDYREFEAKQLPEENFVYDFQNSENEDYYESKINPENITGRLKELSENTDGIEIFVKALEVAVMGGDETVKIPEEIDPEEHNITLEDALARSEQFVREQLNGAQNLMSKVGAKIDEIEAKHEDIGKYDGNLGTDKDKDNSNPELDLLKTQKREIYEIIESLTDASEDLKEFRASLSVEDLYSFYYDEDLDTDDEESDEISQDDEDSWIVDDYSNKFSTDNITTFGILGENQDNNSWAVEDSGDPLPIKPDRISGTENDKKKIDIDSYLDTEVFPLPVINDSALSEENVVNNDTFDDKTLEMNSTILPGDSGSKAGLSESDDIASIGSIDDESLSAEIGESDSLAIDSKGNAVLQEEADATIFAEDSESLVGSSESGEMSSTNTMDDHSLSAEIKESDSLAIDSKGNAVLQEEADATIFAEDSESLVGPSEGGEMSSTDIIDDDSLSAEIKESDSLGIDSDGNAVLQEKTNAKITLSDGEGDSLVLSENVGLTVDSDGDVAISANADETMTFTDEMGDFVDLSENGEARVADVDDVWELPDFEEYTEKPWALTTKTPTEDWWEDHYRLENERKEILFEDEGPGDNTSAMITVGICGSIFFLMISLCACAKYRRVTTYRRLTIRASPVLKRKKVAITRPQSQASIVTVCEIAPTKNKCSLPAKSPISAKLPSYLEVVSGKIETPPKYDNKREHSVKPRKA